MVNPYPEKYLQLLKLIKIGIALKGTTKAQLAEACGLNRSYLGQMLSGARVMPYAVQRKLIEELDLQDAWKKFDSLISRGTGDPKESLFEVIGGDSYL